jgi:hypothetical protein
MAKLNPQVLKFAEQAKGFVDLNQHVGGDNGCMIYNYEGLNKFAELIVRECANRASWAQDTGEEDIGGEVLKHFGVEE